LQYLRRLTILLKDKDKEEDQRIKRLDLDLKLKIATAEQARLDYDAETKRLTAIGNSGPAVSKEQVEPLIRQIVTAMLNAGDPAGRAGDLAHLPGVSEGGTPIEPQEAPEGARDTSGEGDQEQDSMPGVPGSRLAPDGKHYTKNAAGQYLEVQPAENA